MNKNQASKGIQTIVYKVQTCNSYPEVVRVIDGFADTIVKECASMQDAVYHSNLLNVHNTSIEVFKEFTLNEINADDYTIENTTIGFTVTSSAKNYIQKWEVDLINTFCECNNFKWAVVSIHPNRCSFEIQCYY